MTGNAASGPMLPRPSTAEPSVTTATVLRLMVSFRAADGSFGDGHGDPRHARGVGHREVVARLERDLGLDRDRAAQVQQERAVAHGDDPGALHDLDGGAQ